MRHLGVLDRMQLPGSALHLAFIRVVFSVHAMTVLLSPAIPLFQMMFGDHMPETHIETAFPAWLEDWLRAGAVVWIAEVGAIAAAFAALGLFTRVAMPVLFAAFLLTQEYYVRVNMFHDDWVYFDFFLLVLCLAPCADALALDRRLFARKSPEPEPDPRYRWPVELMILWFASIYFAAALAKLFPLDKGLRWLAGNSTRDLVVTFMPDSPIYWLLGRPLFDYNTTAPFVVLSVVGVVVELAVVLLLTTHRYRVPLLASLLGLHVSIYCFGIPAFVQIEVLSMVLFLPPHWFVRSPLAREQLRIASHSGIEPARPMPATSRA